MHLFLYSAASQAHRRPHPERNPPPRRERTVSAKEKDARARHQQQAAENSRILQEARPQFAAIFKNLLLSSQDRQSDSSARLRNWVQTTLDALQGPDSPEQIGQLVGRVAAKLIKRSVPADQTVQADQEVLRLIREVDSHNRRVAAAAAGPLGAHHAVDRALSKSVNAWAKALVCNDESRIMTTFDIVVSDALLRGRIDTSSSGAKLAGDRVFVALNRSLKRLYPDQAAAQTESYRRMFRALVRCVRSWPTSSTGDAFIANLGVNTHLDNFICGATKKLSRAVIAGAPRATEKALTRLREDVVSKLQLANDSEGHARVGDVLCTGLEAIVAVEPSREDLKTLLLHLIRASSASTATLMQFSERVHGLSALWPDLEASRRSLETEAIDAARLQDWALAKIVAPLCSKALYEVVHARWLEGDGTDPALLCDTMKVVSRLPDLYSDRFIPLVLEVSNSGDRENGDRLLLTLLDHNMEIPDECLPVYCDALAQRLPEIDVSWSLLNRLLDRLDNIGDSTRVAKLLTKYLQRFSASTRSQKSSQSIPGTTLLAINHFVSVKSLGEQYAAVQELCVDIGRSRIG